MALEGRARRNERSDLHCLLGRRCRRLLSIFAERVAEMQIGGRADGRTDDSLVPVTSHVHDPRYHSLAHGEKKGVPPYIHSKVTKAARQSAAWTQKVHRVHANQI